MNRFVKIISMPVVCIMLSVGSIARADIPFRWDEDALRASVCTSVGRALRRATRESVLSLVLRDDGYEGKNEACAGLCEIRIELLKKILQNEIFLPVDVELYLRDGFVETDSYEAERLRIVASALHNRKDWKPKIDKLIEIYKSIKWGYESRNLDFLMSMM